MYIYEYYGGGKTCCIFFTQHINIFSTQSVAAAVEISQICNIIITAVFYEKYILWHSSGRYAAVFRKYRNP